MLGKERKKLRDVDHFTILDYIKTSIEILMNMKMEETELDKEMNKKSNNGRKKRDRSTNSSAAVVNGMVSDTESMHSTTAA
jgi:predicted Holliday junction resolvase-like endonuclease